MWGGGGPPVRLCRRNRGRRRRTVRGRRLSARSEAPRWGAMAPRCTIRRRRRRPAAAKAAAAKAADVMGGVSSWPRRADPAERRCRGSSRAAVAGRVKRCRRAPSPVIESAAAPVVTRCRPARPRNAAPPSRADSRDDCRLSRRWRRLASEPPRAEAAARRPPQGPAVLRRFRAVGGVRDAAEQGSPPPASEPAPHGLAAPQRRSRASLGLAGAAESRGGRRCVTSAFALS